MRAIICKAHICPRNDSCICSRTHYLLSMHWLLMYLHCRVLGSGHGPQCCQTERRRASKSTYPYWCSLYFSVCLWMRLDVYGSFSFVRYSQLPCVWLRCVLLVFVVAWSVGQKSDAMHGALIRQCVYLYGNNDNDRLGFTYVCVCVYL